MFSYWEHTNDKVCKNYFPRVKLDLYWNVINFIDQERWCPLRSHLQKQARCSDDVNLDGGLDKEKKGVLETMWGRNIQSLLRALIVWRSGEEECDASKIWTSETGRMVELLRNARKGDYFGEKLWWILWYVLDLTVAIHPIGDAREGDGNADL